MTFIIGIKMEELQMNELIILENAYIEQFKTIDERPPDILVRGKGAL